MSGKIRVTSFLWSIGSKSGGSKAGPAEKFHGNAYGHELNGEGRHDGMPLLERVSAINPDLPYRNSR